MRRVISSEAYAREILREEPDAMVSQWLEAQPIESLGVSVITLAEIGRGLKRLPGGRRRTSFERRFVEFIEKAFRGRVFAFDESAAARYGEIAAGREAARLHVGAVDLKTRTAREVEEMILGHRAVG